MVTLMNFSVEPELREEFKDAAFQDGRSMGNALRLCMRQYIAWVRENLEERTSNRNA